MKDNLGVDRAEILAILETHRDWLAQQFGARGLGVFGSAARDEMRADSDVDILVEFDQPPTFERYFGLKDWLEQALGRRVDLVTPGGLKPRARQHVERDLIRVA